MTRTRDNDSGSQPLVTVITVVYNGAEHIARTIESVLVQDHPSVEYIVIDGQSTDATMEIVQSYGRDIDRVVSEPDQGVYDAMNKGVALASGTYLLMMNCGDVFASPSALSSALREAAGADVLFGRWRRRERQGAFAPRAPDLALGLFNHQATLYRHRLHAAHGPYATVSGFTAADYLFFSALIASRAVVCRVIETEMAEIDVTGLSAGPQTLSQKTAIDFLHGRTGRWRLAAVLALHPIKLSLQRWLRKPQ